MANTKSANATDADRLIGELRAANQKLEEAAAANADLQADRSYLASIVDSSNDAIIGLSLSGLVKSWNRAADRMFGFKEEEILGKPVSILYPQSSTEKSQPVSIIFLPAYEADEAEIIKRIQQGEIMGRYETLRRHKSGNEFPVSMLASPIHDSLGRIVGVAKIINDISEQRRIREELRTLQAEMAHISRWNMMGMMAASLAHELNQPLTAMLNYVRAAKRTLGAAPGTEKASEFLDKAADETKLAGGIIRSLRDFIEKREASSKPDDINSTLEEGLSLSLTVNTAAKARILRKLAIGLPHVMIDRVQIQQVLLNLVRNAFEAMQDNPSGKVVIETSRGEEGFIIVSVRDNGPGLPHEISEQLFQPFQTTKQKGMGVGLSICKMIIEAHGGRIWMEANQPHGANFRFQLPLAAS